MKITKEIQTAIRKSIEHWQRMIQWAEKQPANKTVDSIDMSGAIYECWSGKHCELCLIIRCNDCPLAQEYGECSRFNKLNLWGTVAKSETWSEWVKNAKRFMKQLESLEEQP